MTHQPSTLQDQCGDLSARPWKCGFIFFCRHDSFRETFERMVNDAPITSSYVAFSSKARHVTPLPQVFGLARHKLDLLHVVQPGECALFLFDQVLTQCSCSRQPCASQKRHTMLLDVPATLCYVRRRSATFTACLTPSAHQVWISIQTTYAPGTSCSFVTRMCYLRHKGVARL